LSTSGSGVRAHGEDHRCDARPGNPVLETLKAQADANGVHDLTWLDRADAQELEPAVSCVAALLSPSTGIVDSHGLMTALRRDAVRLGAQILLSTPVLGAKFTTMACSCRSVAPSRRTFFAVPS